MKSLIGTKLAGNLLLVLFGVLAAFHVLILLNLLPSGMVWGGQAANAPSNLRTLETISFAFTILFALVVAIKVGYIGAGHVTGAIEVLLWIIFAYLLLNTAGNLASSSSLEKLIFAPITIVAALLVLRLAIEK